MITLIYIVTNTLATYCLIGTVWRFQVILTVGKKDFHHHEHNQLFSRHNSMKVFILFEFNREQLLHCIHLTFQSAEM